jgi:Fe-S oxidoreductase
MTHNPAIFAPILVGALVFFAWSCCRRLNLLLLGQPEDRFSNPGARLKNMFLYAFAQLRVMRRPFGANHAVLFWAFLVLLLANGEFLVNGVLPGVSLALLPGPLHHALLLAVDIVSLLALVAVLLAASRRLFFRPAYLDSAYVKARSPEAFIILGFIFLPMTANFGLHGARIATGVEDGAWMPVAAFTAELLAASPLASNLEPLAWFSWWLHAVVLLTFICFLPLSKHMHILTAIPNCFFKSLERPVLLPREEFAPGNNYGADRVDRFTWKDLLDSHACTECGRCQDVCPAAATGKPLNPRQVVHAIKINLLANGPLIRLGGLPGVPLIGSEGEGTNSEEAIWSCTTCGACLEACPVCIEQMPKIVKMRRHLVQETARFPGELLNLFENMEQRSNPWGIAPSERTRWSSLLGDRTFKPGETEYLFFVGCAGAFDSRNKHVTVALATIMDAAGVSWGMLGREELCCGDSVRRLGNEYVFDRMAKENVALFREKGITKVVTQCPHCFSTLKNDYRQYGLDIEVVHHSRLIAQLAESGRLTLAQQAGQGKVIFHDSCYLGRHNDTYEAPRAVLKHATGSLPEEFGRHHEQGFCCGAGGGRMWMEEQTGSRINLERVREALQQRPDTLCVSCPYCMTMMEDGLKDLGLADTVRVRDIAEVTAEALAGPR